MFTPRRHVEVFTFLSLYGGAQDFKYIHINEIPVVLIILVFLYSWSLLLLEFLFARSYVYRCLCMYFQELVEELSKGELSNEDYPCINGSTPNSLKIVSRRTRQPPKANHNSHSRFFLFCFNSSMIFFN